MMDGGATLRAIVSILTMHDCRRFLYEEVYGRSANTGISGFINQRGDAFHKHPIGKMQ